MQANRKTSLDRHGKEFWVYLLWTLVSAVRSPLLVFISRCAVRRLFVANNDNITAKPKQKTYLENVMPTLDEKLFTVTVTADGHGKWNFGYIDETQYSGTVNYVPFGKCTPFSGYWTVSSLAVTWQGLGGSFKSDPDCIVVGMCAKPIISFLATTMLTVHSFADSGTDTIILDSHTVEAYYKLVRNAKQGTGFNGYYYFPCTSQMPDLVLQIGDNYTTKVSGSNMNTGPTAWDPKRMSNFLAL